MTASLHSSLIGLVTQAVLHLPRPLRRVLDAWSHQVARRRAVQRQRLWQQQKMAAMAATAQPSAYHLKPWRD
jgi:hypothetical protein